MIWNQHLLYQIIDVWYHIKKLYLINNEKNDKIKLNHFFHKRRPIDILIQVKFKFSKMHLLQEATIELWMLSELEWKCGVTPRASDSKRLAGSEAMPTFKMEEGEWY